MCVDYNYPRAPPLDGIIRLSVGEGTFIVLPFPLSRFPLRRITMLKLALVSFVAASLAFAQNDGPVPGPNADPTDTTNIRLNGKRFRLAVLIDCS